MISSSAVPFKPALINAFRAALHCFFLRRKCCKALFGLGSLLDWEIALASFFPKRSMKKVCSQESNFCDSSEVDNLLHCRTLKICGMITFNSSSILHHILSLLAGKLILISICVSRFVELETLVGCVRWQYSALEFLSLRSPSRDGGSWLEYTFEATLWCVSGWVDKDNLQLFLGTVCVREFKLIFLFASMRADLLTEPIANSVVHFTSDAWTSSSLVLGQDRSTRPDGVKVSLAPRFLLSQGGSATGAPTHSFGFSVLVVSIHEVEKLRGKSSSIHAVSSSSQLSILAVNVLFTLSTDSSCGHTKKRSMMR